VSICWAAFRRSCSSGIATGIIQPGTPPTSRDVSCAADLTLSDASLKDRITYLRGSTLVTRSRWPPGCRIPGCRHQDCPSIDRPWLLPDSSVDNGRYRAASRLLRFCLPQWRWSSRLSLPDIGFPKLRKCCKQERSLGIHASCPGKPASSPTERQA
jgi:hypothetical protein